MSKSLPLSLLRRSGQLWNATRSGAATWSRAGVGEAPRRHLHGPHGEVIFTGSESKAGPTTLILTQTEVAGMITSELALPVVEKAFAALASHEAAIAKKIFIPLPEKYGGEFIGMPGFFDGSLGLKWVNMHPDNVNKHGLPALMGIFILNDPETAVPLAIMDGTLITAVRTGCAGAVASKYLAKKVPKTLGIIGTGVQARMQLATHRFVYSPLGYPLQVLVADKNKDAAEKFVNTVGGKVVSVEEAAGADIVIATTPSREPIIKREWIHKGAHINAFGADSAGKQELDPAILQDAKVFVDDEEQALTTGELNVPFSQGLFKREHIAGNLGDVVAKRIKGRTSADDITLFDSTGLAIHDVGIARAVYNRAIELGIGHEVHLFDSEGITFPRDA